MIRLEQEPLRTHTTFRIGGPAAYYFIPEREEEIIEALDFAKEKGLSAKAVRLAGFKFYIENFSEKGT